MKNKIAKIKNWLRQTERQIETHSICLDNGLITIKLVEEEKNLLNTKFTLIKVIEILEDK